MKKNIVITILAVIVLSLSGYFIYDKVISKKDNAKPSTDKQEEIKTKSKYLLKKLTDSVDDKIEFYDEFVVYDSGYVFQYRNANNESKVVIFDKEGHDITNTIYDNKTNTNVSLRVINDSLFSIEFSLYKSIVVNSKFKIVLELNNEILDSWFNKKYLIVYSESNNKRLYGIYDIDGKKIIDKKYEYLYSKEDSNYLLAEKDDKTGVIDINDNIIIPFEYDKFQSRYVYLSSYPLGQNYLLVKDGIRRIVNIKNKEIIVADSKESNFEYNKEFDIYYLIKYDDYVYGKQNSVKFYKSSGEFIKEISLSDELKIREKTIYDNDREPITFVDNNENTYELNKNFELENKGKIYCTNYMNSYSCHTGKGTTTKINDSGKYVIYDNSDKALNYEFVSLHYDEDYIYGCLDKIGDTDTNCGYIDYKGNILYNFKYDNTSDDIVFKLNDKTLYNVSLKNIKEKTNVKYNYEYYMPIKDYVLVRTNGDGYVYDLSGNLIFSSCFNVWGIYNDDIMVIEYYNKDAKYSTKLYNAKDISTELFEDIKLNKNIYNPNNKYIYYGDSGIYELVFE